ncbi:MAG: sulfurtransferase complex subunit TusB [Deltaproteobacteria bacterium]|nr:sulfurtransferase complex subunit TusB [Deltaproteobacteria bacterium]
MLHTINQSPFRCNSLKTSIRFILPDDPVLFLEDGVYSVQDNNTFKQTIETLLKTNPVYAISHDINARGIKNTIKDVQLIDYEGFVDLVEKHQVNTWF